MTITLKIGGATTGRKFTDPIRYFKANDPYYWEVDNIPIKQLQENIRYVNDRLNTAIVSGNLDTSRDDIAELKPYVNGTDDVVRVRAGRYTARINNAHGIEHLEQFVRHTSSDQIGYYNNYTFTTDDAFDLLIDKVKATVSIDALNLNGLSERVFAQLARNPDRVVDPGDEDPKFPRVIRPLPSTEAASPGGGVLKGYWVAASPISEYLNWFKYASFYKSGSTGSEPPLFQTEIQANLDPNTLMNLPVLENALIKYWRGTARTAVVDVYKELDIVIEPFDPLDFEEGDAREAATSRIDLVFIYSKPVDTSAVTIGNYVAGGAGMIRKTITKPELGVLHGAGIGLDTDGFAGRPAIKGTDGRSRMLASVADQNNTDNGFKKGDLQNVAIHGSFPSPEDLLNIAPLLSEQLEEDSWFLTGQTIFPVAYVKVNKVTGANVKGTQVITKDDLVDIRPIFRTAELTYNERAGIAAAVPPLSIANRAVGRYELDYELNNIHEDHDTRLDTLEASQLTFTTEHTYFLTGKYDRGGRNIINTYGDNVGALFLQYMGTKERPAIYDLANMFHHSIAKPEDIISVILTIEGNHLKASRDVRDPGPPVLWINGISEAPNGNRAQAEGVTSKWSDQPMMRFGSAVRKTNMHWFGGGGAHTFYQPVEYNPTTKKLEIYVWSDRNPNPLGDYGDYYYLTFKGYIYNKTNKINLL